MESNNVFDHYLEGKEQKKDLLSLGCILEYAIFMLRCLRPSRYLMLASDHFPVTIDKIFLVERDRPHLARAFKHRIYCLLLREKKLILYVLQLMSM